MLIGQPFLPRLLLLNRIIAILICLLLHKHLLPLLLGHTRVHFLYLVYHFVGFGLHQEKHLNRGASQQETHQIVAF